MTRSILSCLVFLLWVPSGFAQSLDLSNLPSGLRESLLRQNPGLESQSVSWPELERILRDLVLQEQYDSAEIDLLDSTPPVYRIRLGQVQKILAIDFHGLDELGETEVLREFGLTTKSAFDQQLMIEGAERVRAYYDSQGFAQARIDLQFERSTDPGAEAGVRVTVNIAEGPRTTVQEFQVLGENRELADKLTRKLRKHRGNAINDRTLAAIRSDLRVFLARERYFRTEVLDPQIEKFDGGAKARLIYQFKNVDRYYVETEGNAKITRSSLNGIMNLNEFSTSNPNVGAELGSKVKAYYLAQGFARAEVNVREEAGELPFQRVIRILINEGPRIKIKRIDWIGRFSQTAEQYTEYVFEHSSETMEDGFFVKEDLDTALKNLTTSRWNQGFLRARIVSTRTSYNAARDEISLQVNYDEGPLTRIRDIRFEGPSAIPQTELLDLLLFKQGEALKLNDLEESIGRIRGQYQSRGFLEMTLINERQDLVRYSADNTEVEVVFQIYEGPQVQVGSIVVEGNTITNANVILKELEFGVGDTLSPEILEESVSRLQRLGHFSSVEIRTLEEKTPISVRTVIVRVQDRDPGLFNLGFGVNSDRGFTVRGYTGVAYRNIAGTGRGVSARLDANYNVSDIKYVERKITLGYLEPYIFDTRIRGRVNVTRAITVSDYSRRIASEVNQMTYTLEQDITSHILLSWDVFSLATVRDFLLADEQQLSLMDIATTALTMDLDYRDHPFNPTRGTFTRLNAEYGAPWLGSTDTIEYIRGIANFSHYQSMKWGGLVWANSVRLGYLKNLSTREDGAVPYDKKGLLLGGQSTIRGFTPDEAFPNRFDFGPDYDALKDRYNLKTEADMYLIKSEIRFPVWGNIGGAVFYDGGAVAVRGVNMQEPFRHSVGIAARYSTPVGAVSLEYGWKLNRKADRGEAPGVFHFSIGTF